MANMQFAQSHIREVEAVFDGLLIRFSDERCALYSTEFLRSMFDFAEEIHEEMPE
jgi:hypothetical protein